MWKLSTEIHPRSLKPSFQPANVYETKQLVNFCEYLNSLQIEEKFKIWTKFGLHPYVKWDNNKTECRESQYCSVALYEKLLYRIVFKFEENALLDDFRVSGPGSSVSIATGYGLDGPGIES